MPGEADLTTITLTPEAEIRLRFKTAPVESKALATGLALVMAGHKPGHEIEHPMAVICSLRPRPPKPWRSPG